MIELNRNYHLTPGAGGDTVKIKVVGIGGAGSNALDRMMLDGLDSADLVTLNTDVQSLSSSVATAKVQLGRDTTRGLGAGGDPEIGMMAAQEAEEEIRQALDDSGMIFISVGLGGGTGSGAGPFVARIARERNALVVVFATMPFTFEGKRRTQQAEDALAALHETADVVICFENDKMGDAVSPKAGIHQAFAAADQTISQSVRAIANLFAHPGILRIGFDDLAMALRNHHAQCVFGFGEADGDNRAHDALARALKNPLMDRGRMLSGAQNVLVNVAGGPGMTLNEVQILMEELGKHIDDDTRILFGTSVEPKMGNCMSVTIISSVGGDHGAHVQPVAQKTQLRAPEALDSEIEPESVEVQESVEPAGSEEEAPLLVPDEAPPVEAIDPPIAPVIRPKPALTKTLRTVQPVTPPPVPSAKAPPEPKQETLQFEPVTRGRFEKSEPTIVDGQDLDVPTFLRRNVRVK